MSVGMAWGAWLAQPPEHRALYLAVQETRRRMNAVDERLDKEAQEAERRRRG